MEGQMEVPHVCGCSACRTRSDRWTAEFHGAINRVMIELNEKDRRLLAGLLARRAGRGGIQRVVEITGMSRATIRRGCREIRGKRPGRPGGSGRIRQRGGGRKRAEKKGARRFDGDRHASGRRHRGQSDGRPALDPQKHA